MQHGSRWLAWLLMLGGAATAIVGGDLGSHETQVKSRTPHQELVPANGFPLVLAGAAMLLAGVALELAHLRRSPPRDARPPA